MKAVFLNLLAAYCLIMSSVAFGQNVELNWAKQIANSSSDTEIKAITTDASGNVYTVGSFANTVDLDPGVGITLTSAGNTDIFVSKRDAAGNYVWARRIGGQASDYGNSIKVDPSGNVYITGSFQWKADFDPGEGIAELEASSSSDTDIFICKLDPDGKYVWAKRIGSSGIDSGSSIALDASGNVYTTGSFQGTVDFDPGDGTAALISAGSFATFISKLDANGNYLWVKSIGKSGMPSNSYRIALDASGNVYTTGSFQGSADFDPGEGTAELVSSGFSNFMCKLDVDGNYRWAKIIRGVTSFTVDGSGNIYTSGDFSGTFDPGDGIASLTSHFGGVDTDILVCKLDTDGHYLWAKGMGGDGNDVGRSIAVDGSGSVYTTGYFTFGSSGIYDFDPGEGIAHLYLDGANSEVFISKLDAGGNYQWAKRVGAQGNDEAHAIAVDGNGNVYTTGYFSGSVDFDPGVGTFGMTSEGESDIFILKLSPQTQSPETVHAYLHHQENWQWRPCPGCDFELTRIQDANGRYQYVRYLSGDELTWSMRKYTISWNGSAWEALYSSKSYGLFGMAPVSYRPVNGMNTSPKPPCTGWSGGVSLSGGCAEASAAVTLPEDAPAMNPSGAQTSGINEVWNAEKNGYDNYINYEIPVVNGAPGEKVTLQWNATQSRWELVHINPVARTAGETILSTNTANVGQNPPCSGWSNGYAFSGDICTINEPMPVSLLSFTAETSGENIVKLNWSTAAEQNAGHFGIERSADARGFREIAKLAAKGDSYEIKSYVHTDEAPLRGRSYYRLRQVDRDGSYTYSKVVSVRTTGTDVPYPNPAKNGTISIEARDVSRLNLTDLLGRNIPFFTIRIDEETVELRPHSNLQPGIYVISNDGMGYRVVVE